MAIAHATLSNFRQSPRKMRLVVNLVRGKKVADALVSLEFTDKKASTPIKTLIASALANAKALDMNIENLVVKTITVNAGKTLQRRHPAARGSAHPIHKRTSMIFVELGESVSKKKAKIIKESVEVIEKKPKAIKKVASAKTKISKK